MAEHRVVTVVSGKVRFYSQSEAARLVASGRAVWAGRNQKRIRLLARTYPQRGFSAIVGEELVAAVQRGESWARDAAVPDILRRNRRRH